MDREIRAQERHYQAETKKHKEAELQKQASQVHTQLSQLQKGSPSERASTTSSPPIKSPRDSLDRTLSDPKVKQPSEKAPIDRTLSNQTVTTISSTGTKVGSLLLDSFDERIANESASDRKI